MPTLSSVGAPGSSPPCTGEAAGNFCARGCQGRAVERGVVLPGAPGRSPRCQKAGLAGGWPVTASRRSALLLGGVWIANAMRWVLKFDSIKPSIYKGLRHFLCLVCIGLLATDSAPCGLNSKSPLAAFASSGSPRFVRRCAMLPARAWGNGVVNGAAGRQEHGGVQSRGRAWEQQVRSG